MSKYANMTRQQIRQLPKEEQKEAYQENPGESLSHFDCRCPKCNTRYAVDCLKKNTKVAVRCPKCNPIQCPKCRVRVLQETVTGNQFKCEHCGNEWEAES